MSSISKSLLKHMIQGMIKRDQLKWPHDSAGAYYQPMRPEKGEKNRSTNVADSQSDTKLYR